MEGLNELENAVLTKLLAGEHPILATLRLQVEAARLATREYSGNGFFCTFAVPPGPPPVASNPTFRIGDVDAKVKGLKHGAGFVLFVKNGYLDMLEGYSYEEPWPAKLGEFALHYQHEPRIVDSLLGK